MTIEAHPRSIRYAMLRRARPWVAQVADWMEGERSYVELKFPDGTAPHDDITQPERLYSFVNEYMKRSLVLGLDQPAGRQALAKATRTMLSFTEAVVRQIGPIPPSGVSSGNLEGSSA